MVNLSVCSSGSSLHTNISAQSSLEAQPITFPVCAHSQTLCAEGVSPVRTCRHETSTSNPPPFPPA